MNPRVDGYLKKAKQWPVEMAKLRQILLGCHLTEDLKWGKPCYAFEKSNVVIIQGFKQYLALLFFKGALLRDPRRILVKPGENSQAGRQIRFANSAEIEEMKPVLKGYIEEAIQVEKAGLKVKLKKITEHKLPEELQNKFDKMPALRTAFRALTPGRQRAYILYFSGAKQSKTREARIDKFIRPILSGKGLND
ncbi:MAG: YdeI/OmpD-associated family protein [Tepidisphaeraceae bacterium]|jgi:uncharacterized protein YdeI (YjbR/CyaY-like superfamily)